MTTERVLGITTRIGCRVACSYCPQDKFTRAYRQQSVEPGARFMLPGLFEKYLATVPTSVKVSFAGHAEPFLNDRCIELVEHAVSKGHSVGINTTLHGMTLDDVERLGEISFVNFIIHLPGFIGDEPNEKMIVDETYLAVLDRLLERNIPTILRVHGESTHPDAERVIRANGGEIERRGIRDFVGTVDSKIAERFGRKHVRVSRRLRGRLEFCSRVYQNLLLPSGDVVLCCQDWQLRHVLGSLGTQSYDDIADSEEVKRVIDGFEDESIDTLC